MKRVLTWLAAAGLAFGTGLAACATEVAPRPGLKDAIAITYDAVPLSLNNPRRMRVGRLIYRGGLELSSPEPRFGGWSGLVVSRDGTRMLAQSDEGHWLRARLFYGKGGNLIGVDDAQLADMLDERGRTMRKRRADAEGLAALSAKGPDGPVIVSFERVPRVWRYDLSGSLDARPTPVPMPDGLKQLYRSNKGLEGLTVVKPGTLLAVGEAPINHSRTMPAWLAPTPGSHGRMAALHVKRHAPYEISDAAMGPSGRHLYLLERHYFGLLGGVVMAVREIDASTIKPGATLDGHEIARFTMRETIDNMEGLALRRTADGRTLLYMISDDNYDHVLQRTLLLMFELAPPRRPAAQ